MRRRLAGLRFALVVLAMLGIGHPGSAAQADTTTIRAWLTDYDATFNKKDLDGLTRFYHADVTIHEGTIVNTGWADYREHHLGPEIRAFVNPALSHTHVVVTMLPGGQAAYVTSRYALKATMGDREIDTEGVETLVVIKVDGTWKIRHAHTSGRSVKKA